MIREGTSGDNWIDRLIDRLGLSLYRRVGFFILAGGTAAAANLAARFALNAFLPFEAAVALAFLVGMTVAFVLYQGAVFGNPRTPLGGRIWRFCVVDAVAIAITLAVSSLLARWLLPSIGWTFHPFEVAHFVGVGAPAVWSFFAHKHLTFASRPAF